MLFPRSDTRRGQARPLPRRRPGSRGPADGEPRSERVRLDALLDAGRWPGLGIFLGCVGKSAQFPLQVWLPDAMEGPTPVSALIHAATMVAAGVYLVGRCYPLFTPEALLVIAYTGGITLFVAATIAVVMTDIKKVLAYSTVSQLGYMMLALGVGGWVAGLFHLITHAFFKALLFLGSGSVIYGCHHEQEMTQDGRALPEDEDHRPDHARSACWPSPAFRCSAAGTARTRSSPRRIGFVVRPSRSTSCCSCLPLVTAGITTFYMFRMWFMTFTGKPRDQHVHDHAHESPWLMTVPLVSLAVLSVCVAWGWPVWDAERQLAGAAHPPRPADGRAGRLRARAGPRWPSRRGWPKTPPRQNASERHRAHEYHFTAGDAGPGDRGAGHRLRVAASTTASVLDPAEAKEQFPGVHAFLVTSGISTSCTASCWSGRPWSWRTGVPRLRPDGASTA